MNNSIKNYHAVVTGGSRGIGAAIAEHLDGLGVRLTLMGRHREPLEVRCRGLSQAQAITVDVTDEHAVNEAFRQARETLGPVAILINNAGAAESAPFERTDSKTWHRMLDVNLTGIFHCTRPVLKDMRAAGWGRIVNIASTAGIKGYAYISAYCAAKHGAIGLTRALAMETARTGITVNAVCPGYTETDLLEAALRNIMDKTGMDRAAAEAALKSVNPQNRFIDPKEVAATVAWLCLPGSGSVSGQAIALAGGEVMP